MKKIINSFKQPETNTFVFIENLRNKFNNKFGKSKNNNENEFKRKLNRVIKK